MLKGKIDSGQIELKSIINTHQYVSFVTGLMEQEPNKTLAAITITQAVMLSW